MNKTYNNKYEHLLKTISQNDLLYGKYKHPIQEKPLKKPLITSTSVQKIRSKTSILQHSDTKNDPNNKEKDINLG